MHSNTKITPKIRKEIYQKYLQKMKIKDLAEYYHIHRNVVWKIVKRAKYWDFSVHKSTREDYRTLKYWLAKLEATRTKILHKIARQQTIVRYEKEYAGELMHIDLHKSKNVRWRDPKQKRYFAGLQDDSTRTLYSEILPNKKATTVSEFMIRANKRCNENWIRIKALLSDNGKEFTTHHKSWIHKHIFEKTLVELEIIHKYTRVRRPETNGKIERYWRTLKWWFESNSFISIDDLKYKHNNWLYFYNNIRWHSWIKGLSPMQKLNLQLEKKLL